MSRARYEVRGDGYRRWRAWDAREGRDRYLYVHQLLAISEGADPARVFSDGNFHVHHRSEHKQDNRPGNLELRDGNRHLSEHGLEASQRLAADGGEATGLHRLECDECGIERETGDADLARELVGMHNREHHDLEPVARIRYGQGGQP